jgi:ataxia telangiectasia mutated family protein
MLLLQSINDSSSSARIYRMQLLLFLIDGHWTTLDQKMQRGIITSLLQSLSFEENVTQSFAFLCFAAAAESTTEISNPSAALVDSSIWDQVWTGALRKMSNAAVCRSACHCATILLKQAKCLLSSSRIIHEVEMLMSDLDVHGPPGLEDSISDFFVELLVYAHQDVRLYHMKIEDKLLAWLPDVWRNPTDARARGRTRHLGPLNHVPSSLNLIEGICGLQHRAGLLEIAVLPDGAVVDTLLQNDNTALIRDFLLHARLPDLSRGHGLVNDRQSPLVIGTTSFMIASSGRERRASAILLKVIETASDELEEHRGSNGQMPAEDARCYLDLAVVSMAFCSSLARNGIKPNRRILQLACKLVTRIVSSLPSSSWTVDEKAYVMHGMAPLVLDEEDDQLPSWEPMVKPGFGTGIKREALVQLLPRHGKGTAASDGHQGEWRNVLWQDADVSDFAAFRYIS